MNYLLITIAAANDRQQTATKIVHEMKLVVNTDAHRG